MKSKNIIQLLSIVTFIVCTLSCNDDFSNKEVDNLPPDENVSFESDKEALYLYQTNKDMILYSLIRFDYKVNKYVLDATEKDIEKLGISIATFEDGKKRVEQMNEVNIERE